MEIKNFNLDRNKPDTEYIRSRQDFQKLMADFKTQRNPVWKQPLFYGVIGLATFAIFFAVKGIDDRELDSSNNQLSGFQNQVSPSSNVVIAGSEISDKVLNVEEKTQENTNKKISHSDIKKTVLNVALVEVESIEPKSSGDMKEITEITKPKNTMPHIAGYYYGEISLSSFCGNDGIQTNEGTPISSFKIQYASGNSEKTLKVSGNKIPDEVCEYFKSGAESQMVFITDIFVKSTVAEEKLPSLNFWINV